MNLFHQLSGRLDFEHVETSTACFLAPVSPRLQQRIKSSCALLLVQPAESSLSLLDQSIFRHLLDLLCLLTASVPRYSSVLVWSFSLSKSPPPPCNTTHLHLPPRPHGSSAVHISVYTSGWGWRHRSALPHGLTSPQMPIYCTWQPLWSRRTSGVEYAYWKTGANLGPNKCSRAKPMKGSLPPPHTHTHTHTHPQTPLSGAQISPAIAKTLEGLDSVNKNLMEALRDTVELMMWLLWSCWIIHSESVCVCVCVSQRAHTRFLEEQWTFSFDKVSDNFGEKKEEENKNAKVRFEIYTDYECDTFILLYISRGIPGIQAK